MKLYTFVCKNLTNIWAGIGSGTRAVSNADPSVMAARRTRASDVQIGQAGIIYCSKEGLQALTTPFLFTSKPRVDEVVDDIWPERWMMPFGIKPLGTPKHAWSARDACGKLPFNKGKNNTNISSVFKTVGTAVFSPIDIGEEDWAMIFERLVK